MTYIRHSAPRCVACGRPQGRAHRADCRLAQFIIRRADHGQAHNPTRVASRGTPAYAAGEYLYKHGAQTDHALFKAVDFTGKSTSPEEAVQRAMTYGWLIERDGKIDISPCARAHFDKLAGVVVEKPVGQIAAFREPVSVFTRPALSKKHIPNPRGLRQDIPAWSVRTGASFHTKA